MFKVICEYQSVMDGHDKKAIVSDNWDTVYEWDYETNQVREMNSNYMPEVFYDDIEWETARMTRELYGYIKSYCEEYDDEENTQEYLEGLELVTIED